MSKLMFYIDSMQMGGANRVMSILVNYFSSCGYDVVLVNDALPENGKPEYDISKTVKRVFLDSAKKNKSFKNLKRIFSLRKVMKTEKIDTAISFMGPPNIRLALASLFLPTYTILSVRNDPNVEYGRGIKKIVANILFKIADKCVFQTEEASKYFGQSIRKKSSIILNPVDAKFFKNYWKPQNKEIVVVGRLQPQKNPFLALKAFSKVADVFKDYSLVFYGDDELSTEIIKMAYELNLSERVEIRGKTKNVENVMTSSALYLLSSNYEGLPNTLMEAMAVGIPVISTNCPCGGPSYLIQKNRDVSLVECGNEEQMAQSIKKILNDPDLQQMLSNDERNRAKEFDTFKILNQWQNIIIH